MERHLVLPDDLALDGHELMVHLLGSFMLGARFAPVCAFAILQNGCGESTEIRGKAVATMMSNVTGEPVANKTFVMDAGNTGHGERWRSAGA